MSSDFISLRKEQLRSRISEAREFGDQNQLLCLRSQWVHRHGIETLSETEQEEQVQSLGEPLLKTEQQEPMLSVVEPLEADEPVELSNQSSLINEEEKEYWKDQIFKRQRGKQPPDNRVQK